MSTDRELLELAAKAAGIDARRLPDAWPDRFDDDQWNPLIDDGDALRLAVKLIMLVEISEREEATFAYAGKGRRAFACEDWQGDKNSATRRAIVQAAAAIGRTMS